MAGTATILLLKLSHPMHSGAAATGAAASKLIRFHAFSTTTNVGAEAQRPQSETGRRPTMIDGVSGDASTVPNLTSMKRGPGYRSSFSGMVATVFGASGAVGRAVCNRLGKSGTQFIVPYRGDHYRMMRLKVCGDLGQVLFTPYDLKDEESCRKAMMHSDVVINLIGRQFETRNYTFEDVNIHGPRQLAKLARECGVKNFIHISALNASEKPKRLFMPKGSKFLRTKYLGEAAVLKEFPDATIFRPSQMYGTADYMTAAYNEYWRRGTPGALRTIPLWKKGDYTVQSPLHMSNLADGIMAALDNPSAKGVIYQATGPDRFLLSDLVDWMFEVMHKNPTDWRYKRTDLRFDFLPLLNCAVMQNFPIGQKAFRAPTLEYLERSQLTDDVVDDLPTLEDLGVKLNTVQDEMPWVLEPHRAFRFNKYYSLKDKPIIHPLHPISRVKEREMEKELAKGNQIMAALGFDYQN